MTTHLKKLALAIGVISSGIATAGTMGPVYQAPNWTGFYLGANAGGLWGESGTTVVPSNIPPAVTNAPAIIANNGTNTFDKTTFTGGFQAGYNMQFGNVVGGIEGDFNYTNFGQSRITSIDSAIPGQSITINQDFDVKWLSTVRGRLGYAFDNVLVYATGGWAGAKINATNNISFFVPAPYSTQTSSFNKTQNGWTAGAGAEMQVMNNVSIKAEYLYVDLGNQNNTSFGFFDQLAVSNTQDFTANILRAGVNYRF